MQSRRLIPFLCVLLALLSVSLPASAGPTRNTITAAGAYNWSGSFQYPGVNGAVNAVAVAGGDVYIGGDFTEVGGVKAYHVAKWDGATWSEVGFGVDGAVNVLAYDEGSDTLYAGGTISSYYTDSAHIATTSVRNILKWDGVSWSEVGFGFDNAVYSLAIDLNGGNLYAGGAFTTAYQSVAHTTTSPANRVARWDGAAWSQLDSGMNNTINALVFSAGDLYAGGRFTAPAHRIARWSGTAWSEVGYGLSCTTSCAVYALASDPGGTLYAGGNFTSAYTDNGHVDTGTANRIAQIGADDPAWSEVGFGLDNAVTALALDANGVLYAGGIFTGAFSGLDYYDTSPANHLASWDGAAWDEAGYGLSNNVGALVFNGDELIIGGSFEGTYLDSSHTGIAAAANLVAGGGAPWGWTRYGYGAQANGTNGVIASLVTDNSGNLYAAGSFTAAGAAVAYNIARWNGSAWNELGHGLRGTVYALAMDSGGNLYAGGMIEGFYNDSGHSAYTPVNSVARWNGTSWSALGEGLDDAIYTLAVDVGDTLYAGGDFSGKIARWDEGTETWNTLGANDGPVYALALDAAGTLFAGGDFSGFIAQWDGETETWATVGDTIDSTVFALAFDSATDTLFAGGDFVQHIALWDGLNWTPLDNYTTINGTVNALVVDSGGNLYAGGAFSENIALWDGADWNSLGGGLFSDYGAANALVLSGGYLYAGGSFSAAGSADKSSAHIGRWTALETRAVNGSGSYSFYSATYPVTIDVVTQGTLAKLVMLRHDTYHPATTNGHGYYWQIEAFDASGDPAAGYTVDLTFTAPGFTPNSRTYVCKFLNPGWDCQTGSLNGAAITRGSVTALSEWILANLGTTAVDVVGYTAQPEQGGVALEWQTVNEADLVGFNVYRGARENGPFLRLNPMMIPVQTPGEPEGNFYRYFDQSVKPGQTYFYKLEVVFSDLTRKTYFLKSSAYLLRLPLISR